jgi:hypothetical protein
VNGRGVLQRKSLPEGRGVIRDAAIEQRRGALEAPHERPDDVDVLLVDLRFHVGRQIAAAHHHRAAHLEHARGSCAIADDAVEQPEVDARLLPHHHRLGGGEVVYGHQQVGDELQLRPDAELTAVVGRARETVEYPAAAIERAALAAGVDRDVLRRRLRAGAADRAVEQDHALTREPPAQAFLQLERHRAGLDHDGAGTGTGSDSLLAEVRCFHCRRRGQ